MSVAPKNGSDDDTTLIKDWGPGLEEVLRKEGEEAESLFWGHQRASVVAARNNDIINIPSIVLQTVTGFLSATGGMVHPIALGAISVFTGILSTLLAYYKFSAKAEGHRMASQLYFKIYKKIEVELSLPAEQREPANKLLEEIRDKLARVGEVAPDIPESVIAEYKIKFKDGEAKKPIIFNGLDAIKIYVPPPKEPVPMIRVLTTEATAPPAAAACGTRGTCAPGSATA
jgi:hypothetical protein